MGVKMKDNKIYHSIVMIFYAFCLFTSKLGGLLNELHIGV